jgi:hypothetical protein
MAADSPPGGATLRSAEELRNHAGKQYRLDRSDATSAPHREAVPQSLVCGLCGKEYATKGMLIRHALGPHYRSNRSASWVSAQNV